MEENAKRRIISLAARHCISIDIENPTEDNDKKDLTELSKYVDELKNRVAEQNKEIDRLTRQVHCYEKLIDRL